MASSSTSGSESELLTKLEHGELTGSWTLDPARSSVALHTHSFWGLLPVKGSFAQLGGQAEVTTDGQVTGSLSIVAASIDTRNKKRDAHLRSADFFDVAHFPSIVFTLRGVTIQDRDVAASGELQVRGVTHPLDIELTLKGAGEAIKIDTTANIDRSDFELNWNQLGMVAMKNVLTVTAVFVRQR